MIASEKISFPSHEATAHHYKRNNVLGSLFTNAFNETLIQRPTYHASRALHALRTTMWSFFKRNMNPSTFFLFSSLFGGSKEGECRISRLVRLHFKTWGTSHYLARSGAHLAIFASFWTVLLRAVPGPMSVRFIFLTILLGIYTLLSWSTLSFLRAFYMVLIGNIMQTLNHKATSLHLLTLTTFLTLLYNPLHLFFLDFQLSFGFSYALLWVTHIHHARRLQTPLPAEHS